MSLQAARLLRCLAEEGVTAEVVATNPLPPRGLAWAARASFLRTLLRELQYIASLIRKTPRCSVLHHFSASDFYFFAHSVPALLLAFCLRKRFILNYRGGNARAFLKQWAWCAIPLLRLADRVVVPSEFLRSVFTEFGLEASLLPNIAATETFAWKERHCFHPRFLIARNLEPMYNVECALRAFRRIQVRYPDAQLGIAGDGSEKLRLAALASDWNLRGVTFHGSVAHHNLPSLYASHDIFMNSSNVDNFPGAIVEAACSGLPIVTTRAGGIPWMIQDRENGMLADLGDDAALAAAAVEIVSDPSLGRDLARRARSWAEQFSWKNVFPLLLATYGSDSALGTVRVPEHEVLT
ncbi:MAG TPA: glycosyltransferase family 4 protein [Candidatus Binatia bacterium]|nr:glycosyltransferase family 4 protein [Candidatus Binatia bacterium]